MPREKAPYKFSGIAYRDLKPESTENRNPKNFYQPCKSYVDFPNFKQLSYVMELNHSKVLTDRVGNKYIHSSYADSDDFNETAMRFYVKLKGKFPEKGSTIYFTDDMVQAKVINAYCVPQRATGWVEFEFQ